MKHTGRKSHKPKAKNGKMKIFNPITEFSQACDFIDRFQREKGEIVGYSEAEIIAMKEERDKENNFLK